MTSRTGSRSKPQRLNRSVENAMMPRWILPLAVFGIVIAGQAHAAALFTSAIPVSAGNNAECIVTNVGTTPLDITVELLDEGAGSFQAPTTCANRDPGRSCGQFVFGSPVFRSLTCKVVTPKPKKVRGILINVTTGMTSEAR